MYFLFSTHTNTKTKCYQEKQNYGVMTEVIIQSNNAKRELWLIWTQALFGLTLSHYSVWVTTLSTKAES